MNQQTIKSQDLSIEKLFDDFYIIPDYQREYVWQEKQIEQLLNDIYTEFPPIDFRSKSDDYFIGSIVVCSSSGETNNLYEVIDGQQRITTAYIFSCVVKNYIIKLENHAPVDNIKNRMFGIDMDAKGFDVARYKVNLQYGDSSSILEKFAQDDFDLDTISPSTDSAKNLVNAYNTIQNFITREFGQNESELRSFYLHFSKKIKLVRVETIDVNHALRVFETINDRGVGLNPMDLLKNLMFKQVGAEDFQTLNQKWKELNDAIHQANEKPFSFLRYFILSHFDVEKRDDLQNQVYEWLLNNASLCQYQEKPIEFVEKMRKAAKAYTSFVDGKNIDGTTNRYLDNIKYLTPNSRQHVIMLLAAMDLSNEHFMKLCCEIENLLFIYIVAGKKLNEFERTFIKWASELRQVKDADSLSQFISNYIEAAKQEHKENFKNNFLNLQEKDLQKYRLKYILAKLTQYVNEKAFGSEEPWSDLKTFAKSTIEIEHILPQILEEDIIKEFDKPDEIKKYISKLGNLTLLEKSINASISNGLFANKKNAYKQSQFYLTKSIAEKVKVGTNTAIDRAVTKLKEFAAWTSQSIEERQQILTELAKEVWGISEAVPEVSVDSAASSPASGEIVNSKAIVKANT